jgi:adenylate kinase family enzyme
MECPPEVLLQRLTNRAVSSDREDDAEERIKKRIDIFRSSDTKGLLDQLSKNPLQKVNTLQVSLAKSYSTCILTSFTAD